MHTKSTLPWILRRKKCFILKEEGSTPCVYLFVVMKIDKLSREESKPKEER